MNVIVLTLHIIYKSLRVIRKHFAYKPVIGNIKKFFLYILNNLIGGKFIFKFNNMSAISTTLFILPFISAIFLFLNSRGMTVLYGLILILATIFLFVISYPLEKAFAKKFSFKILSYLMPIYYFILAAVSVTLSWKFINSSAIGNFWVFLFAFSCCCIPYNYMLQKEQTGAGKVGILTNATNNFSVLGYLLFGILMNFTPVGIFWSYGLLVLLGLFLLNGLPVRIQGEANKN